MKLTALGTHRNRVNRRAFLRAAGGIAVGLPFLEGLPERSAWAQDAQPVFGLFMVAACGVVGGRFWPSGTGALTSEGLASSGKAVAPLAPHASNLLLIRNVNWPMNGPTNCGHAQGLCMSLTARPASGGGQSATSSGISADMEIAKALNAAGTDPLTLYAGNKRNGYIAERISFKGAGAGQVRAADDNPWQLYSKLVTGGAGMPTNPTQPTNPTEPTNPTQPTNPTEPTNPTPMDPGIANELATTRKSVNDLVRAELNYLMNRPQLSSADKLRLDQHFQAIRDAEITMGNMAQLAVAQACSMEGLDTARLESMQSGWAFSTNGMIEEVAKLHMQLVAVAFACNYNRVATIQWGDGTDATVYNVPSNQGLGWKFHHLSHRVQSDATSGNNPTAENAHAEIDKLRMETLAAGLNAFADRGLQDSCFVLWTNHIADGPSHSFRNVPHIVWGNAGGYLKTGQDIDAGGATNNKVLNTLITAAGVRRNGGPVEDFGQGSGSGQLAGMLA